MLHKCAICNQEGEEYLAQCEQCKEYFCNQKSWKQDEDGALSHIIRHMRQKHNQGETHFTYILPPNKNHKQPFKAVCEQCNKESNIIMLYFLQHIEKEANIIVCGECKDSEKITKEYALRTDLKLVQYGAVLPDLVSIPLNIEIESSDEILVEQSDAEAECAECGLRGEKFLAKCLECEQYFCNSTTKAEGYDHNWSHIFRHCKEEVNHTSFSFPYNQIPHTIPKCQVCNNTNLFDLCFLKQCCHNQNQKSVIVCFKKCIQDNGIQKEYRNCEPLMLIANGEVCQELLPTIQTCVPYSNTIEKNFIRSQSAKQPPNRSSELSTIQDVLEQNDFVEFYKQFQTIDDEKKQLEFLSLAASKIAVIPAKFNIQNNELLSVNGKQYYYNKLFKFIESDQIQHDTISKTFRSLKEEIQNVLRIFSKSQVSYADLFETAIHFESQSRQLECKLQGRHINASKVYVRQQVFNKQELQIPWSRERKISRSTLAVGDEISLLLFDLNEKTYIKPQQCIVQEVSNFLILQLCDGIQEKYLEYTPKNGMLKFCENINIKLMQSDSNISEQRMIDAIHKIDEQSHVVEIEKAQLYKIILGQYQDFDIVREIERLSCQLLRNINIENEYSNLKKTLKKLKLNEPNQAQQKAIRSALESSICLIQGCPGGGKTCTMSYIIFCLQSAFSKTQNGGKVLCCAGSNIAADNIGIFCNKMKLNVLRVYAKALEDSTLDYIQVNEMKDICLSNVVERKILNKMYSNKRIINEQQQEALENYIQGDNVYLNWVYQKQQNTIEDVCESNKYERQYFRTPVIRKRTKNYLSIKEVRDKYKELELIEINAADIIISTCCTSGDKRLVEIKFAVVLLDESSQVIEPEQMIAIQHTAKQVILIGDHKQLGPNIKLKQMDQAKLSRSLFQRLMSMGVEPVSLDIQYRMNPGLLEFCNKSFYNNSITSGIQYKDRVLKPKYSDSLQKCSLWLQKLINNTFPSIYINAKGEEYIEEQTHSYNNEIEARIVLQITEELLRTFQLKPSQIGIITPYSAQHTLLLSEINDDLKEIEVCSVDGFQGREKEVIIYSAVRSNSSGDIGFLTNEKRMNVTLTRARSCFIMIGNADVLCEGGERWKELWNFYIEKEAAFEGANVFELMQAKNIDKVFKKQKDLGQKKLEWLATNEKIELI